MSDIQKIASSSPSSGAHVQNNATLDTAPGSGKNNRKPSLVANQETKRPSLIIKPKEEDDTTGRVKVDLMLTSEASGRNDKQEHDDGSTDIEMSKARLKHRRKPRGSVTVVDIEGKGRDGVVSGREESELPIRSRTEVLDNDDEELRKRLRAAAVTQLTMLNRTNSAACTIL